MTDSRRTWLEVGFSRPNTFVMSKRRRFLASIATLGLMHITCTIPPATYAEDSNHQSQAITGKLNEAFGDKNRFTKVASDFVNQTDASFACKWWIMKAHHQHELDIYALNKTKAIIPPEVLKSDLDAMQRRTINLIFLL